MCLGGGSSQPKEDPQVKMQQEAQKAEELSTKRERRDEALEETVTAMTGGKGRRTLMKSPAGGIGFYNRYLS